VDSSIVAFRGRIAWEIAIRASASRLDICLKYQMSHILTFFNQSLRGCSWQPKFLVSQRVPVTSRFTKVVWELVYE
jgi:hypothetical protein